MGIWLRHLPITGHPCTRRPLAIGRLSRFSIRLSGSSSFHVNLRMKPAALPIGSITVAKVSVLRYPRTQARASWISPLKALRQRLV